MRLTLCALTLVAWSCPCSRAFPAEDLTLKADGWNITAHPATQTLTIGNTRLGNMLENVRLLSPGSGGGSHSSMWNTPSISGSTLLIRTAQPEISWIFAVSSNYLRISSSSSASAISAIAPASSERIPVRTLDRAGVPVNWTGTEEVVNSYDGTETRNQSFLPQTNADAMYFGLGQIDGDQLHSLFDRKSDVAIDFGEQAKLTRTHGQPDTLDVALPIPGNAVIRITPDYFTKTLGVPYYQPFDDSHFPKAPMVWSSWTSYYAEVTEREVVENADWIATHLEPYGFQYVQLDDGYDRLKGGEHSWIENWDRTKFPHGPAWLTGQIKEKGLKAGIWLVPNAYAGGVAEHPDWYVRTRAGKLINDYQTPALDSTNPEVLAFLKKLFTTLDGWGFQYYKFDGEHAFPKYVPAVDSSKLHNPAADPLVVYRDRLNLIRDVVGPQVFIEGCPAGTPLNGIGFFNSYFNGDDVYNSWQGMYPLFSSINANAFLNHIVIYLMPGEGMDVGPEMSVAEAGLKRNSTFLQVASTREKPVAGFGTTLSEARTLVTYIALTGVVYPLSSVLPELPEERVRLLRMTLPTQPVLPIDLFSRGTDMRWDKFKYVQPDNYIHNYPEILDLKVNSGSERYDVVGLTNWRSGIAHRSLDFHEQLGLPADLKVQIFDFWKQDLLGEFSGRIPVDVDSHDTRVLLIRSSVDHPQLVGDSRHISGVYSSRNLAWNGNSRILQGTFETVNGDTQTLTISVPVGFSVEAISAFDSANKKVAVTHRSRGRGLILEFRKQPETVNWKVAFRNTSTGKAL